MSAFDQQRYACRCEWGPAGVDALASADVIIVVDVLSFTTCVDVAVSRGAAIVPYPWKDASAQRFAVEQHAELAQNRGMGTYSLSPASFLHATRSLRCVLPSPNGAALAIRAALRASVVLAASLRNAAAVAAAAREIGSTFNVCPAGERWPDGLLRPCVEDWIGAGAVLAALPGAKSPEAAAAMAAFEQVRTSVREVLMAASSGRELIARGFADDVDLASELNVSSSIPRIVDGAFVDSSPGRA